MKMTMLSKIAIKGMTWYYLYEQRQGYITLYIGERSAENISKVCMGFLPITLG